MCSAYLQSYPVHDCVNIYTIAYLILKHAKFVSPLGHPSNRYLSTFIHCADEVRKTDRLTAVSETSWLISDTVGIVTQPLIVYLCAHSQPEGREHYNTGLSCECSLKKIRAMIWNFHLILPVEIIGRNQVITTSSGSQWICWVF